MNYEDYSKMYLKICQQTPCSFSTNVLCNTHKTCLCSGGAIVMHYEGDLDVKLEPDFYDVSFSVIQTILESMNGLLNSHPEITKQFPGYKDDLEVFVTYYSQFKAANSNVKLKIHDLKAKIDELQNLMKKVMSSEAYFIYSDFSSKIKLSNKIRDSVNLDDDIDNNGLRNRLNPNSHLQWLSEQSFQNLADFMKADFDKKVENLNDENKSYIDSKLGLFQNELDQFKKTILDLVQIELNKDLQKKKDFRAKGNDQITKMENSIKTASDNILSADKGISDLKSRIKNVEATLADSSTKFGNNLK